MKVYDNRYGALSIVLILLGSAFAYVGGGWTNVLNMLELVFSLFGVAMYVTLMVYGILERK